MILYLDTSALLKLHIDEEHAASVRLWAGAADRLATSVITLPEAAAAIIRRRRLGHLEESQAQCMLTSVMTGWEVYARVSVDETAAAALAWEHGLRGMDAVHLAAANAMCAEAGARALAFASFDGKLNRAAAAEGLIVLEPSND